MFASRLRRVRALVGLLLAGTLVLSACAASPGRVAPSETPSVATTKVSPVASAARAPHASSLERDVAMLRSDEFASRSRAADRLVAAGEEALPALGRAGEGDTRVHGTTVVSTTRPVIRSILADADTRRLYHHLDSPWPVVRREAAEEIGRRGQWSAVPRLIARLDDADVEVRAAAASSLRRLTNRFFGYDARARQSVRADAARRWSRWWDVQAAVGGTRGPMDPAG